MWRAVQTSLKRGTDLKHASLEMHRVVDTSMALPRSVREGGHFVCVERLRAGRKRTSGECVNKCDMQMLRLA